MLSKAIRPHWRGALILASMMGFIQVIISTPISAAFASIGSVVLYYASLGAHELGHYAAASRLGAEPKFVGANVASTASTIGHAVLISSAGPVAGALSAALAVALYPILPSALVLAGAVLVLNHLAMFLPAFPDGRTIYQLVIQKESNT